MDSSQHEIYVSTDIETDGPIPGPCSMLSFASAAFLPDKTLVGTYTANLQTLPTARPDTHPTPWWAKFPEAWAAHRKDPRPPAEVMPEYVRWVKALPGTPIFVAYPATFDFMFVQWYLHTFAGEEPFGNSGLDIKTYAMAVLKRPYRQSWKKQMPRHWFDENLRHTHIALDDALEQGVLFCNILAEHLGQNGESESYGESES